jgi:hypothetical protein
MPEHDNIIQNRDRTQSAEEQDATDGGIILQQGAGVDPSSSATGMTPSAMACSTGSEFYGTFKLFVCSVSLVLTC